mgnify:CR=1 FL=1
MTRVKKSNRTHSITNQNFILNPGSKDIRVGEVFTESMFSELKALMLAEKWEGVEDVEKLYNEEYKHKTLIEGNCLWCFLMCSRSVINFQEVHAFVFAMVKLFELSI